MMYIVPSDDTSVSSGPRLADGEGQSAIERDL